MITPSYEYDQVSTAVNAAANMVTERMSNPDQISAIDFVVNAALTLLVNPEATEEDVIADNWGDSADVDTIRDIINFLD